MKQFNIYIEQALTILFCTARSIILVYQSRSINSRGNFKV